MKKNDQIPTSRRTLLKAAAGVMGTTLFGGLPFRSFAQAAALKPADRCFVFVYFSGGWDQLLAFDPRDPEVFTPERVAEILEGVKHLATGGQTVLLTAPDVRRTLRKLCEGAFPDVAVLTYGELDMNLQIRPLGRLSPVPLGR